jgi:hypothetical protein
MLANARDLFPNYRQEPYLTSKCLNRSCALLKPQPDRRSGYRIHGKPGRESVVSQVQTSRVRNRVQQTGQSM